MENLIIAAAGKGHKLFTIPSKAVSHWMLVLVLSSSIIIVYIDMSVTVSSGREKQ